jgi:F0F1-type ATP synthase membrane subunit b/b'
VAGAELAGRIMTEGNAELAMIALVIIVLVLVFAVIWFVFMVPMEKGLHDRRMQLIQRRLREKEQEAQRQQREGARAEDVGESRGTGRGQ